MEHSPYTACHDKSVIWILSVLWKQSWSPAILEVKSSFFFLIFMMSYDRLNERKKTYMRQHVLFDDTIVL